MQKEVGMAGPSTPEKPGVRCGAVLQTGPKTGERCTGLLLTKNSEVLCHNREHHPRHILDVLGDAVERRIVTKEAVVAIIGETEPNEKGGKGMTTQTKTESLREVIGWFQNSIDEGLRAKTYGLDKLAFDPDRIEKELNMPMRIGERIPLGVNSNDKLRSLVLQFRVNAHPDVPVEISFYPMTGDGLEVLLRVGSRFLIRHVLGVRQIDYYTSTVQFLSFEREDHSWTRGVVLSVYHNYISITEITQEGNGDLLQISVEPAP